MNILFLFLGDQQQMPTPSMCSTLTGSFTRPVGRCVATQTRDHSTYETPPRSVSSTDSRESTHRPSRNLRRMRFNNGSQSSYCSSTFAAGFFGNT